MLMIISLQGQKAPPSSTFTASLTKVYQLTTSIDPNNFVGLAISRDRSNRSIIINQLNYVATLIDRFSIRKSSAKYSICEDYLTGIS